MIIVAVILSGVLPKTVPFFKGSIHFYGEVELGFASILEMVMILAAAFCHTRLRKRSARGKSFYMGCDPRGCNFVYRNICNNDSGIAYFESERCFAGCK